MLESLPGLVDAGSGSVSLRLVPHHLPRLHPPDLRGEFVPCGGDPNSPYEFPLLRGASPVDVSVRGGMKTSEVSGGVILESAGSHWSRSWWRWIAHALTPFGWVYPTPEFIRKQTGQHVEGDLLASLSLTPMCDGKAQERYRVAEDWLAGELGSPESSGDLRE